MLTDRGRFLKIKVIDENHKFNIIIPLFLINSGFSLSRFVMKFIPKDYNDKEAKKVLEIFQEISPSDIRELVDALRMCKGEEFIEVKNTHSSVSIKVI